VLLKIGKGFVEGSFDLGKINFLLSAEKVGIEERFFGF
jgi:hypothetical protein